jgi:hypothetical protein
MKTVNLVLFHCGVRTLVFDTVYFILRAVDGVGFLVNKTVMIAVLLLIPFYFWYFAFYYLINLYGSRMGTGVAVALLSVLSLVLSIRKEITFTSYCVFG